MSKKNKEVALMPTALAGTEVASGIDMRLSKSDLIEMVVEERRAQLEKQISDLSLELGKLPHEDSDKKACDSLQKLLAAEISSDFNGLIKAMKAAVPKAKVDYNEYMSHCYVLRQVQDNYGHGRTSGYNKMQVVDKSDRKTNSYDGHKPYYRLQMTVASAKNKQEQTGRTYVGITVQKEASAQQVEAWRVEVKASHEAEAALHNQIVDLKNELAELGRKGGRYKAELTKRLLSGTTAGKELLGAMEGVRALMIADGTKK